MAYPTYTDSNGFVRFESNDNIPFADYLEENHPHVDIEAHDERCIHQRVHQGAG